MRSPQRFGAVAAALAVVLVAAACGASSKATGSAPTTAAAAPVTVSGRKARVVTTVAPITSLVANIAGDKAEVRGVVPEGTNSHTFEPRPSNAKALAEADLIFVNGLKLEDPTVELAKANKRSSTPIVSLGDKTITPDQYIYDFSFPKDEGKPNPHLWTDPPLAKRYAEVAKDELSRIDPANAAYYAGNYEKLSAKIDELDKAMRASFATIPDGNRKLLTYHDAYAYFGRDYGWQIIGAIQVSSFQDPTPKDVASLISQVKKEQVPAIFGSEVFPSPVLAQIGKETGVKYVDVLRDDDLPGKPGDTEHSWLGLMRFDYITMTEALGGDASALKAVKVEDVAPDQAAYPQ